MTIGVLEVNPEVESISAQRGRARSALFYRVLFIKDLFYPALPRGGAIVIHPVASEREVLLLAGVSI